MLEDDFPKEGGEQVECVVKLQACTSMLCAAGVY